MRTELPRLKYGKTARCRVRHSTGTSPLAARTTMLLGVYREPIKVHWRACDAFTLRGRSDIQCRLLLRVHAEEGHHRHCLEHRRHEKSDRYRRLADRHITDTLRRIWLNKSYIILCENEDCRFSAVVRWN